MKELVTLRKDDVFTTSDIIAEGAKVSYRSVQRLIENNKKHLERFGQVRFEITPVKYKRGTNEKKVYILNEKQAYYLLTLMKNTDIIAEFRAALIDEFFRMREFIYERHTAEWIETRKQSKLTRKNETDVIQLLVRYAEKQGSKHADMLYMTYSKLANSAVGITERDNATARQLDNLRLVESVIENEIRDGISNDIHYKDIYSNCKVKLVTLNQIARLTA